MLVLKNRLQQLLLFFAAYLLVCCHEKPPQTVIYKEPSDTRLDATCQWLNKKEHFHKDSYLPVFYAYYQKKLANKDYRSAAYALGIVANKKIYFVVYDQRFLDTIHSFTSHYQSKAPARTAATVNSYLGNYYLELGNFKKAIAINKNTLSLPVNDYDSCIDRAYAYFDIAFCYFSMGDQNLAQKYNLKALEYFRKTDSNIGIGSVYSTLGSITMATRDYGKSEAYYDKAIEYFRIEKDTGNILTDMYNKIHNYDESNNPKLYPYIDYTYSYLKKSKFKDPSIYISIATYYTKKLLHENKIAETRKVLDDLKPMISDSPVSLQEYNIAMAEYEIKYHNKIVNADAIKSIIPTLRENENYQGLMTFYDVLKADAVAKNDYKSALFYEQELQKAADSIGSREMQHKVIELDKKYQFEKNQQQLKLQETAIFNKNTTIALLLSVLIGVILILTMLVARQKQRKLKLERMHIQSYTKQLLEKTEEERQRIASDLHDSISHELLGLKNVTADKAAQQNKKIDSIINDIRNISRNLHPVMFEKIGLQASVEQLVEKAQAVNDFMVTSEIEYKGRILGTGEQLQLYRILQESLSNIIKHAEAMAAKITIIETQDSLHVEIKDNGKGFDVAETLAGTAAFGLHNIIERGRAIGAETKIVSTKNGTVITLEIKDR